MYHYLNTQSILRSFMKLKKTLVNNLIDAGEDISSMGKMKTNGMYLNYTSPSTVVGIFQRHTEQFFDGTMWRQAYSTIPDIPEAVMETVREQLKRVYLNCLEDCAGFISAQKPDPILVRRTRNSLQYLQSKLES